MEEEEKNESSVGSQIAEKGKESVENAAKQTAQKVTEKAAKKIATKGSLMGPIAHAIMYIAPIIILALIIIGIIIFLLTMPGMLMDKLKALFNKIGNALAAFFGADTTQMIEDSEIYETLDYLEEMGYDLKGFGFLTKYMDESDYNDLSSSELENGAKLDTDIGVIRDGESDKIIKAESDFIYTYVVSDNYVYTLKNKNLATQNEAKNWFESIITARFTACYKVINFLAGPILDAAGVTNAVGETWGKGLLALYYEKGDVVGRKGTLVNDDTLWNWDSISIDATKKTLSIKRHTFLNNNNAMEFSLDGWSGRYGMPLEFLLSVHMATMMPDLAYDMATSFATNVNVCLHKTNSGEAITAFYNGSKYIEYEELEKALSGVAGRNFLSAAIAWFDDAIINDGEAIEAFNIGIPHADGCTCNEENKIMTYYGYVCTPVEEDDTTDSTTDTTTDTTTETNTGKKKYKYTIYDVSGSYVGEERIVEEGTEGLKESYDVCGKCKSYIKKILKLLRKDNDYDFLTYIPYIANVTNHWYRDVYFVDDDDVEFIDYDYDYEAVMRERWTKYETDANGDFVYYIMNEDGTAGEKYEGKVISGATKTEDNEGNEVIERVGNRTEDGRALVKKAELIDKDEDTFEDLGWNNDTGNWIAYEVDDTTREGTFERLYEDDEIEADDEDAEIKKKIYVKISTSGNPVQKGEGLRTETNPTIKKMFLQNRYFKYDGTADTAEYITSLREKYNDGKYGALSSDKLDKSISTTSTDDKGKTTTNNIKISDVSGIVTLSQDSLNAFSMLENTHTLDSDYIYRDFKELIVELGYFEKEELTDETPRLLQWIVPDIGSGGFPYRPIDKNANEFGTMIHSDGDIHAKNMEIAKKLEIDEELPEDPEGAGLDQEFTAPGVESDDGHSHKIFEPEVSIVSFGTNSMTDLINIGSIADIGDCSYTFEANGSTTKGTKTGDLEIDGISYEVWKQTSQTCTLYSFAFLAQAYTGESPEAYLKTASGAMLEGGKSQTNEYWNGGFLGTSFEKVGITGKTYNPGESGVAEAVAEALGEGKPVYFYGKLYASGDCHAIVLLGAKNGKVVLYDPGPGNVKEFDEAGSSFSANLNCIINNYFNHWLFIPDEAPTGVKKNNTSSYTGYKGNEAVVSPVTGILLDYGTYTEEDKSSITGEKYRQNVDLKYQTVKSEPEKEGEEPKEETILNPDYDPEKPDLVGYAKILVLDAENYKKLETSSGSNWNGSNSLVATKTKVDDNGENVVRAIYKDDEDFENKELDAEEKLSGDKWTELNKTVYGYKEFAESYEYGGISGYVVYIDGFECFKPDEEFTEEDLETKSPSTDSELAISMDDFKKVTPSDLNTTEALEDEDKVMPSHYQKDEYHKMASKSATEKLKAVGDVKEQANSTLYTNNMIFIKEGTLLGRTLTDYELIVDYRGQNYEDYRKSKDSTTEKSGTDDEEEEEKIIGNYVRIIFRDTDDTVVENVEDYMKIDDGTSKKGGDQEYKAWPGDLEALAEVMYHEAGYSYLAALSHKFASDQTEADFEEYCMGYSVVNKLLEQNKQWYGHLYDASRTDMSPLVQTVTSAWYGYNKDHVLQKMQCYTEKELEYAEYCLTYDCTSITKPYDTPLGSASIADGYTKTSQGTVIPRAMCQQGGYGDGAPGQSNIILVSNWDHNNNNQFDSGDELWGVDRVMEGLLAQDNVTQD